MYVYAHMLAFMDEHVIRPILIPEEEVHPSMETEDYLHQAYKYGQNDFQPVKGICSVSIGDVISFENKLYMVCHGAGFREITVQEFQTYLATPRRDRDLSPLRQDPDDE